MMAILFPEESSGHQVSHSMHSTYGIVQQMAMCIQYVVVRLSIFQHHWRWFHSSLLKKYKIVSCKNIALLRTLPFCLTSIRNPISKNHFQKIGRKQGLKITYDITDRPASGLCLGIALRFLSTCVYAQGDDESKILQAAEVIKGGADKISVRIQAIYDALLGIQGDIQEADQSQVLVTINNFFNCKNNVKTLRKCILDDLETKEIAITPDLYALILEKDATYYSEKHPQEKKYDSIHNAVRQAVTQCVGLELIEAVRMEGQLSSVLPRIQALQSGHYLIQMSNHILALVKTQNSAAILDSSEGVSLFKLNQQEANIAQMLSFYSQHDFISVNVLSLSKNLHFIKQSDL